MWWLKRRLRGSHDETVNISPGPETAMHTTLPVQCRHLANKWIVKPTLRHDGMACNFKRSILHHPDLLIYSRVSTDLTEQISRRFPGYSRRNLKKKSRTCLHCFGPICNVPNELYLMQHVMMSSNQRSSLCYSTDYNISNIFILHSSMHKQCHIIM